ncbi:hypothetical protein AB0J42_10470 [Nonomuraea sp. NPDC049649]|uniref:hypothetical protein n=1 Tax=Nonomuraea sp. NPDC049649 TaxID=3155776 RepID=UPI00341CF454
MPRAIRSAVPIAAAASSCRPVMLSVRPRLPNTSAVSSDGPPGTRPRWSSAVRPHSTARSGWERFRLTRLSCEAASAASLCSPASTDRR